MAGLEQLKKKLQPLFDADKGFSDGLSSDPCDSYMVGILDISSLYRLACSSLCTCISYLSCLGVRW